jgi:predicted lipid carrier protein YhbT
MTATVHFVITDDGRPTHWLVEIDHGDLRVSRQPGPAPTEICADRALFDAIASGKVNAIAAMLRGALRVDGDRDAWLLVQRLLPGPCSPHRRPFANVLSAQGSGA